jgi:oligopeptidase B
MKKILVFNLVCVIFVSSITNTKAQSMSEKSPAPIAKIIPKKLIKHNHERIDNYFWLNQRENPEVIAYLNQENAFYEAMTADTKTFQKELFEEMKGRIKEDDQ